MDRRSSQRAPDAPAPARAVRWACAAAGAAVAAVGLVLTGCPKPEHRPPQATIQKVPTIRVLLTRAPVGQVRVATTGPWRLEGEGAAAARGVEPLAASAVGRTGGAWRVGPHTVSGRAAELIPGPESRFELNGVAYRGRLRLIPAGAGGTFRAVNHVDVESYLAGVLAKELYGSWPIEAFRAQAIAARTFAMYNMITYGRRNDWDLGDDQASQVYGGIEAETDRSWDAVETTRGIVLAHGPKGAERIFLAQYSACCGGRVNGAYVIRKAHRIPPLAGGQACTDCSDCPKYRWPTVTLSKAAIRRALAARYSQAAAMGRLVRIDVARRTPYGRAVWVDAVGSTGRKVRLRAEDVRLALLFNGPPAAKGLASMNCRMIDRGSAIEFADGRGYGHGVGMCQWGAHDKAERGWSAERILAFYYPGATLYRVH